MKEGAVVPDYRRLSKHNASSMVDHNPFPHTAARVYIHSKDFGYTALDGQRQSLPVFFPKDMGNTARLQTKVAPMAETIINGGQKGGSLPIKTFETQSDFS